MVLCSAPRPFVAVFSVKSHQECPCIRAKCTHKRYRDRDRGKNTRVGEPPGDRVGTTERGRGGTRAWHTQVTARQRERGRSRKTGRTRRKTADGWGNRRERGDRGARQGLALRRAGETSRACVSSDERDQGGTGKKKKWKSDKATKKDKQRGSGRAGGGGSREPTKAQRYTSSRSEKHHADDPH